MRKHRTHTDRAMKKISQVARGIKDHKARWHKINWIIVQTSHKISDRHGSSGHSLRQRIRHRLWREAKQKQPALKNYVIPKDIAGNSPCKIKWYRRIRPSIMNRRKKAIKTSNHLGIISRIKRFFSKIF
jgi:hypothetical protein